MLVLFILFLILTVSRCASKYPCLLCRTNFQHFFNQVKAYTMALQSLAVVLALEPANVKALFRKAKVHILSIHFLNKFKYKTPEVLPLMYDVWVNFIFVMTCVFLFHFVLWYYISFSTIFHFYILQCISVWKPLVKTVKHWLSWKKLQQ